MKLERDYHFNNSLCLKWQRKNHEYMVSTPWKENDHWLYGVARIERSKTGMSSYYSTRAVNPLPEYMHRISWFFVERWLKWRKQDVRICQGCGEGVVAYNVVDPNDNPKKRTMCRLNVCEGCVNFYDFHMSRKRLVWNGRTHAVRK